MNELDEFNKFRELITVFCREDQDAIRLCEDYLTIAHVYDDLIDLDKNIDPITVNRMFCKVFGDIPRNSLYQKYVKEYSALSLLSALTYQIANRFEGGNEDDLIGSFILRNSIILIIYFTIILSGAENNDENWGIEVGELFFRELFSGYHNKYLFFLEEMKNKVNDSK